MARNEDLQGIKQVLEPLEEAGVLVRRTDETVLTQ